MKNKGMIGHGGVGLVLVLLMTALPPAANAQPDGEAAERIPAAEAGDGGAFTFQKGTWTFQTYGSSTVDGWEDDEQYAAHVGVGYHFKDNLSINLELLGGYVRPGTDNDGVVAGLDLLLRWHFLRGRNWSIYVDGGAGLQQADTNFPSDFHFNFRPQAGVGATVGLGGDWRVMGGARWLHVSNAYISEINNGLDSIQAYLGVMTTF